MSHIFRMTGHFAARMRDDLLRPHTHAYERVAFISAHAADTTSGLMLLACEYHPVDDEDYVQDPTVGAMMGESAVRKAMQIAFRTKRSIVHVHLHDHRGVPGFGTLDLEENSRFMPDFFNAQPRVPHAALVLSRNAAAGRIWLSRSSAPVDFDEVIEVGPTLTISRSSQ